MMPLKASGNSTGVALGMSSFGSVSNALPYSKRRKGFGDGAMPPGAVFVPFCYAEAPANMLTNPVLDPDGKIPEFKFCSARVEPA